MIKNIIFDFGDVFINLDKEATARMMIKHGFAGITPDLMELFKAYETGLISTDLFLSKAKNWVPSASRNQLIEAWNAIILDFPEYRLEFIESLARENNYRLFLLSNTNALHIERVIDNMGQNNFDRFIRCFEVSYLSHEVNLRKPDQEIFQLILERNSLVPSETLFIDDTKEHTLGAQKLGIVTWHLSVGNEDVVELKTRFSHD